MSSSCMPAPDHSAGDKLNSLLKGEIAAVETYDEALKKVQEPVIRDVLQEVQQCHIGRVEVLTDKVRELGMEPVSGSGAWGSFMRMVEDGAAIFGDKAAVDLLEQGEDAELENYRQLSEEQDEYLQSVAQELLPKQEGTHGRISELQRILH